MKTIRLTGGYSTIVDDDDFESLSRYRWKAKIRNGKVYAARNTSKDKMLFMHRIISKTPDGLFTDHCNGNTLDNRKENLRHCTISQNNAGRFARAKSGYKGVQRESKNSWTASIKIAGKRIYLGHFGSPIDAARAYDRAAIERYGQFARTNF